MHNSFPGSVSRHRWTARLVALAAILLVVAPHGTARAYNEITHRRIVDHAYQIMRAVRYELAGGRLRHGTTIPINGPGTPTPLGSLLEVPPTPPNALVRCGSDVGECTFDSITQLEWDAFTQEVAASIDPLNRLQSEVRSNSCKCSTEAGPTFVSPEVNCENPAGINDDAARLVTSAFQSRPLGEVDVSFSQKHDQWGRCPGNLDKPPHRLPGMFESLPLAQGMAGDVLGYWSQDVDDSWNDGDHPKRKDRDGDSDVETNLANSLAIGYLVGGWYTTFYPFLRDATNLLLGAVVGSAYCLFSLFWGGDSECYDESTSLVDQTNPIGLVDDGLDWVGDAIGFGNPVDQHTAVGFWHNMPMNALDVDGDGAFDDVDGLRFNGGPYNVPDALQIGATAICDITGSTLNSDESAGPRFQVLDASGFRRDGMPHSVRREAKDWRASSVAHTVWSPLDNLALWGWSQWVSTGRTGAKHLGWPLHAIADAAQPHHTVGAFGFGHVPFENSTETIEHELTFRSAPCFRFENVGISHGGVLATERRCLEPTAAEEDLQRALEYQMARSILGEALVWRRRIVALQQTPGLLEGPTDLPIRHIVHSLAEATMNRAMDLDGRSGFIPWGAGANTPFNALSSLQEKAQMKAISEQPYIEKDWDVLQRPLLIAATAATLAALITIGENVPASALPPNAAPTVAITVPAPGDRLVGVGQDGTAMVGLHAEGIDPEGDAITYRWTDTFSPDPSGVPPWSDAKVVRDLSDPDHPATTADQGPDQTVSLGFAAENCGAPEDHEIVVTATDSRGNTSSASIVIQVSSCVPD